MTPESVSVFRELAEGLWVAERPQRFLGAEIGTRMTVIRLGDGSLFVHSPVALGMQTRYELDGLGPLGHIVAPNRYHHLHVDPYPAAYPEARLYAAPGLPEKRRDLRFHAVLTDEPPPAWSGQVDQVLFRGLPIINEVVFYHRQSRTLIATDIVTDVRYSASLLTRTFFRLDGVYGKFGAGRLWRLLMRDGAAARASVDHILGWDFTRVIMSHGDVIETDGREAFRAAFSWLH